MLVGGPENKTSNRYSVYLYGRGVIAMWLMRLSRDAWSEKLRRSLRRRGTLNIKLEPSRLCSQWNRASKTNVRTESNERVANTLVFCGLNALLLMRPNLCEW